MPRIRKKTSNRGSTNERKKILHKVRESRKKKAKAAKKNPQWKSKHKKDPGIPNNFPYKDQILAEVAEQRRLAAEEKNRRKDEKKAARSKDVNADNDALDEEVAGKETEGSEPGFDGIASLSAKRLINARAKTKDVPIQLDQECEAEIPLLINHDLPNFKTVLDKADVVVEVLDARDPLSFRSSHLEELAASKPGTRTLLVLNKIDTCPREALASWAARLRTHHPTLLFRSASLFLPAGPEHVIKEKGKGKAKESADDGLGVDSILTCLGQWAQEKTGQEPLAVAIVGITNAGKSSFINSLLRKLVLPIYTLSSSSRGPTTTTRPQEITIEVAGRRVRLIDTPGLSWQAHASTEDVDATRARDVLMRSKGRIDRLKDPAHAIAHIVSRSNTEDLMLFYSLPAFSKGDPSSFLSGLARSHQLVKKRGELDLAGASRIVLRDWSTGKFPRYTTPPADSPATSTELSDNKRAGLYSNDESILVTLKTRKEMRKGGGLVKLIPGEIESRKATTDEPWSLGKEDEGKDEDDSEDDEDVVEVDEEADGAAVVEDSDDGDEDNDDHEDQPDEYEPFHPISGQHKRKRATHIPSIQPSKRVSFASDPKSSKQSRTAGSRKAKTQETPAPKSKAPASKSVTVKVKPPKGFAAVAEKERKVGNITTTAKPRIQASLGVETGSGGGDEAYDFGRFF